MALKKKIFYLAESRDGTIEDGVNFALKLKGNLSEFDFLFFTYHKEAEMIFKKRRVKCLYIPEEKEKFKINDLDKELIKIEKKYDCSVEQILTGDYDYNHSVSRKKAFIDLVKIFKLWENLFEKEKPDFVFGGDVRFIGHIPFYVSKQKNVTYLSLYTFYIPNKFIFTETIDGTQSLIDRYWEKTKDEKLSDEDLKKAEKYIQEFRINKQTPFVFDAKPKLNLKKITYAIDRIYASIFFEGKKNPYLRPVRGIWKYLLKIIRARISKRYFSNTKKNEKYIYFPLHVEWDSPIIVWNTQFINQERLIEIISRNLPIDLKLYVKSHPNDLGGNTLAQLKTIKKLPNVRLLKPEINSIELIKNSEATAVIGGTAGWESLLHGKPTIVFGKTYYNDFGLTYNVDSYYRVNKIIKDAIKNEKSDEIILKKAVSLSIKLSHPGIVGFSALYYSNKSNREIVLGGKNIQDVCKGIRYMLKHEFS